MKGKKFKNEKQQGITLIALVVTIVILLILAGISIGALTGDNGIIDQAHTAKEDTESWEEQIDLAIIDAEKKHRNPSMSDIKEELKNKGVIKDDSQVDDETGAITTNEPAYTIEGKLDDYIPFGPGQIAEKNEIYTDENGDTATIPKGFEVAFEQFKLKINSLPKYELPKRKPNTTIDELKLSETKESISISSSILKFEINLKNGFLEKFHVNGTNILHNSYGIRPNFWRGPTDNDYGSRSPSSMQIWKIAAIDPKVISYNITKKKKGKYRVNVISKITDDHVANITYKI